MKIINLISSINYSPKIIAILIITGMLGYIANTFDYVEWKRSEILAEAKADQQDLKKEAKEKEKELEKILTAIDKTAKCIDANSQTGALVDCETLTGRTVEVKSELGNSARPTENNNKEEKWNRLNTHICNKATIHGNTSPLCNNITLTKELYAISTDRGVDFLLMLGIAYAESHIGANYAKGCNSSYNNLGGIKWKITFDGDRIKDQPIPDKNGCWLYKFPSLQEYWGSKARSLYHGYYKKNCTTIECISRWYVRGDGMIKQNYNNNVNVFAKFNF